MKDWIKILLETWIVVGMAVLSIFVLGLPLWIFIYIAARMAG